MFMKRNAIFLVLLLLTSFLAMYSGNNQTTLKENVHKSSIQAGTQLSNGSNFEWGNTYTSSKDNDDVEVRAYDSAVDEDGNIYVVGRHSTGFSVQGVSVVPTNINGGSGIFLLKFSSNGTIEWGIGSETAGTLVPSAGGFAVDVDNNGFVYVGGRVDFSAGSGYFKFGNVSTATPGPFLAKISDNGTPIWGSSASSPAGGQGSIYDIIVDDFGEIFIVGTYLGVLNYNGNANTCTADDTNTEYRPFIAYVNETGYWERCEELSPDDSYDHQSVATGIVEYGNHLFVSVTNNSQVSGQNQAYVPTVIKFNKTQFMHSNNLSDLGIEWETSILSSVSGQNTLMSVDWAGNSAYIGGGIAIDSQGEIVIVGHARAGASSSDYDPWAAKLSQNGTILWYEEYSHISSEMAWVTDVAIAENDDIVISAQVKSSILGSNYGGNDDAAILHVSSNGSLKRVIAAGGSGYEAFYSIENGIDGELIAVGAAFSGAFGTTSINSNHYQLVVARFGADYDSDGNMNSADIDVDGDGVSNTIDECEYSPIYYISSGSTDYDSDGCKDDTEDDDDDNDGIEDSNDSCPTGTIAWVPTNLTDQDNDGCQDSSEDLDDDADGYLDQQDLCPKTFGNSSVSGDLGCVDSDGDGRSDFNDQFPDDYSEWQDSDMDQVGDNADPFEYDASQWEDADGDGHGDNPYGTLGDKFPLNPDRWQDSDDDGYPDEDDLFPNEKSQWADQDGDGYGDNALGDRADAFPEDYSEWLDSDFDGVGDKTDQFPYDVSQQYDSDGDGYGDAEDGNRADRFPNDSTQWSDIDYDGYGDNPNGTSPDAFPTDATQWLDSDGDGYGDNPAGRLYDEFPNNPTQWKDYDGDGLGDNQNGTDADPYLNDLDNDGFNDTIDLLPRFASPGDMDADGCLDKEDLFPEDSRECFDFDGDGEGDNSDPDDDNDGWADTDELREGTDPFSASSQPIDGFEVIIPGTEISLGAWDLIGMFGGFPLFIWIGFGFVTRNTRCTKYEAMLRDANTRDELEQVAHKWEYSLMLRMLGPHQGIRLERLRAELDDKFEAMDQTLSSIDTHDFDQTQMVVEEMNDTEKHVPEFFAQKDKPSIEDAAHKTDDNGYEWFTSQDGINFYRLIGSQADWTKLEN